MRTLDIILYLAAGVCFAVAAFGTVTRVNLIALGLLLWVLVPFIALVRAG